MTWTSLAEPGPGRLLAAELFLFLLVMAATGLHGLTHSWGCARTARVLALLSLAGSVGVVVLAPALPGT